MTDMQPWPETGQAIIHFFLIRSNCNLGYKLRRGKLSRRY